MPSQVANATAIRASGYKIRAFASFITGGTPVATGTLTTAPPYPSGKLGNVISTTYVTGSFTDVELGMEVVFYDGVSGRFKGRTHVRYGPTAALTAVSLPVREFAQASLNLSAGDVFQVYDEWRIHDKLVAALAGFPPDMLFYTDQGSNPPPVACSGGHWAGFVDAGQTYATILTKGDASYTVDPDSGGGVTHLWTLPSGVAFAPGSASTDANPTLEADVGEWTIYHTVTDSANSKATTQHIVLKVHDANNPPHKILYTPDDATADSGFGGSIQIVSGLTTQAAIPDACTVILWGVETVNGAQVSYRNAAPGRAHIFAVGMVRRDEQSGTPDGARQVSFDVISPQARLKELTSYSKIMEANATPDAWSEIKTLGVKRAIIQIVQFYTTLIEAGYDLIFDSAFIDYLYPALYLQRTDFYGQIGELAQGVDARMVCDRTGRFNLHTHPKYIPLASRAAITKTWTFARRDIIEFSFVREHVNTVEQLKASGFIGGASNNTPVFSLYPGAAPGNGINAPTRERKIVTSHDDLNNRSGRYGAEEDWVYQDGDGQWWRAFPLTLKLRGVYDFFDYSKEYQDFSENLQALARDVDLTDFLFCLKSSHVDYDYELGSAVTTCVFDVVTNAAPGETFVPVADVGEIGDGQPPPYEPPATAPPSNGIIAAGTGRLLTIGNDGSLYYTTSGNTVAPVWVGIALGMTGDPLDFVPNAYSPRYLTGAGNVELWVATTTRIYLVEFNPDTLTVDSVTDQVTLTSTALSLRRIETERATEGFVVVVSTYAGGATESVSTTDSGATWGSPETINASGSSSYSVSGNYVSGRAANKVFTSTNTTGGASNGLVSVDSGATYANLTSPNIDSLGSAFGLHVPFHDNLSETIAYFGSWGGAATPREIYRANGSGAPTNISPVDGESYGAQLWRSIDTCPLNRLRLAACLRNGTALGDPNDDFRVYYSLDGGTTWAHIAALQSIVATAYWNVRCAGDTPDAFWVFGGAGKIAKCNFSGVYQDVSGNLATLGATFLLNLAGF